MHACMMRVYAYVSRFIRMPDNVFNVFGRMYENVCKCIFHVCIPFVFCVCEFVLCPKGGAYVFYALCLFHG